jgi:hypothetical protein
LKLGVFRCADRLARWVCDGRWCGLLLCVGCRLILLARAVDVFRLVVHVGDVHLPGMRIPTPV